jgi:small-conductance mechanosensitive channel
MESFHLFRRKLFSRVRSRLIFLGVLLLARIGVGLFPSLFFGEELIINRCLTSVAFFVFASMCSRALSGIFADPTVQTRLSLGLRTLLQQIFRVMVYAFAALAALDHFGISVTPILASLGVGSIAIALALQDTLGNLFSGFYILVDQPFQLGHQVRVDGGFEGRVQHIGWRSTRILLGSGHLLILPNSKLSSSVVTNLSLPTPESVVPIRLGVRANQDLVQVERVSLKIAEAVQKKFYPLSSLEFEPTVRFLEVQGANVEVQITVKSQDEAMAGSMKHELIGALVTEYQAVGIQLRVR